MKRSAKALLGTLKLLVAGSIIFGSMNITAYAFASSGLGTSENPYRIVTCEDLQNIEDDLDAYYMQTQNIDCADTESWNNGEGFAPIGQSGSFSGTYNGQNFTINNIFMDRADEGAVGLFNNLSGATIEKIHLRGGSMTSGSNSYNATLAASATNVVFKDCSSTVSIHSVAQSGLVGSYLGGSMSRCWYEGDLNAINTSYTAGLVAASVGVTFTDVYTQGSLLGGTYGAGLVGSLNGGSVTNAYSSMNIATGNNSSGGLFGVTSGTTTITNVFFAGVFTESALSAGVIAGPMTGSAAFDGVYYDKSHCGCSQEIGFAAPTSGTVTAVNTDGLTPDYFKENETSPPLDEWNFTDIWQTNENELPSLRMGAMPTDSDDDGLTDAQESDAPNNGDANNDGMFDSAQANVVSYLNPVTNNYSVLETDCGSITNVQVSAESGEDSDPGYQYPAGLTAFWVHCANSGDTATISFYNYGITGNQNYSVRKWDTGYKTIPGTNIEDLVIDESAVVKATYQIIDGSEFDSDGIENGVIVDPAGVALLAAQEQNNTVTSGSLAKTGFNTVVLVLTSIALLALGAVSLATRKLKNRQS